MNLNSKYFDRIRISPDEAAAESTRRSAVRVAGLRPRSAAIARPRAAIARASTTISASTTFANTTSPTTTSRACTTTTSPPTSAPPPPAIGRPGPWASTATGSRLPTRASPGRRPFPTRSAFSAAGASAAPRERRGASRSGGRSGNLERRSFAALDLDGGESRHRDQGPLQGPGEAASPRRQWRRPQSSEDRLRQIIQAYHYLESAGFC